MSDMTPNPPNSTKPSSVRTGASAGSVLRPAGVAVGAAPIPGNGRFDPPLGGDENLTAAKDRPDLEAGARGIQLRVTQIDDATAVPAVNRAATERSRGAVERHRAEDRDQVDLVAMLFLHRPRAGA